MQWFATRTMTADAALGKQQHVLQHLCYGTNWQFMWMTEYFTIRCGNLGFAVHLLILQARYAEYDAQLAQSMHYRGPRTLFEHSKKRVLICSQSYRGHVSQMLLHSMWQRKQFHAKSCKKEQESLAPFFVYNAIPTMHQAGSHTGRQPWRPQTTSSRYSGHPWGTFSSQCHLLLEAEPTWLKNERLKYLNATLLQVVLNNIPKGVHCPTNRLQ